MVLIVWYFLGWISAYLFPVRKGKLLFSRVFEQLHSDKWIQSPHSVCVPLEAAPAYLGYGDEGVSESVSGTCSQLLQGAGQQKQHLWLFVDGV